MRTLVVRFYDRILSEAFCIVLLGIAVSIIRPVHAEAATPIYPAPTAESMTPSSSPSAAPSQLTPSLELEAWENGEPYLYRYIPRCDQGRVLADLDIFQRGEGGFVAEPIIRSSTERFDELLANLLNENGFSISQYTLNNVTSLLSMLDSCSFSH